LLRGLVPRRVEVVGEVTGAVVVVIHAPIVACTPSPVNLKPCGKRRVYGSHTRASPAYMEHHVLHIKGLLKSWDSYLLGTPI
jgi:hypothetical protein